MLAVPSVRCEGVLLGPQVIVQLLRVAAAGPRDLGGQRVHIGLEAEGFGGVEVRSSTVRVRFAARRVRQPALAFS